MEKHPSMKMLFCVFLSFKRRGREAEAASWDWALNQEEEEAGNGIQEVSSPSPAAPPVPRPRGSGSTSCPAGWKEEGKKERKKRMSEPHFLWVCSVGRDVK